MPINCNQPNVYQCGKSRATEANEYHALRSAHRTTSLNTKYQDTLLQIAAAPADSHGGDHMVQFIAASQGDGGQLPVHFCVLQLCGHATLHSSVRKQPQRI